MKKRTIILAALAIIFFLAALASLYFDRQSPKLEDDELIDLDADADNENQANEDLTKPDKNVNDKLD